MKLSAPKGTADILPAEIWKWQAVEAIAREELGFMREGEVLFIVRDATPAPRASSIR